MCLRIFFPRRFAVIGALAIAPNRIKSAEALAKTIAANPAVYNNARACMAALPAVRARLATVFD
jgi:hypothetical protein